VAGPLVGRVALVTGASRGIGRAIAQRLAADGARVAIGGRDRSALEAVCEAIAAATGRDSVLAVPGDVVDQATVRSMVATTVERFGKLTVLVNAAGIAGPIGVPASQLDPRDFQTVLAANLIGAFLCCREAIPALVSAGDGRIINIASTSGLRGEPGRAGYVASKWGLRGFTRTLAVELGPQGVTANAVCPHFTLGERTERIVRETAAAEGIGEEDALARIRDETAMGALLDGADTAAVVAFLASEGARHITGQDLVVDAGCVV
jgi:NAD(P)-dependent dehydrogenase (short-subunit alcohol dehydrogenase family)